MATMLTNVEGSLNPLGNQVELIDGQLQLFPDSYDDEMVQDEYGSWVWRPAYEDVPVEVAAELRAPAAPAPSARRTTKTRASRS